MIAELINLYDRLAAADDSHLAPRGYSRQRIGFAIVLNLDGSLHAIEDRRQKVSQGKKSVLKPSLLLVPGTGGRTSGICAEFLWDKSGYLFGYEEYDPKLSAEKRAKAEKRTQDTFTAFREKHLALEFKINCPEFNAVCRFLETWTPNNLSEKDKATVSMHAFGVFQIRGQRQYVHEVPLVEAYWETQLRKSRENLFVQSLVSGESVQAARLHLPWVKGVQGTNANGASYKSL